MSRGTLTTQAAQKKVNRRAEEALRVAEMLCAAATAAAHSLGAGPSCPAYPRAEFERLWRDLLLCQFHDIIPGSSIARVYEECGEMVCNVVRDALALADKAGRSLLEKDADALTFFNPSSTPYCGVVSLPHGWFAATDATGAPIPGQREANGSVVAAIRVPAQAFATFRRAAGIAPKTHAMAKTARGGAVLENAFARYEFDASLRLVRAFDKTVGREFVAPSTPGNDLALFDDHPHICDAWDIEEYAANMRVAEPEGLKLSVFTGPVRDVIVAEFMLGNSRFTQRISLAADSARLDFATHADWRESHRLCRVAFPFEIRSDAASFEIQYGVVRRPTHDNTKWQYAQFECVGHRYADLSDADFGVALLNDCKFGYRAKSRELSLTLLRSPTNPDPFADKGEHDFTYAILPHIGSLDGSDAVATAAAELNQGVLRFEGATATARSRLPVTFEGEGVELAVLKVADGGDDLVVRLVERRGRRATAKVSVNAPQASLIPCLATETEDVGAPLAAPAAIALGPYEIKTLRVSTN